MLRVRDARVPLEHLVAEHEYGLEGELALTLTEEVLKAEAEQVDDHRVIVALCAIPMHHEYTT